MKKPAKREAGRERPASKAPPDNPPSRRSRHTSARIPRFPLGTAKKKQGLSPVSPRSALRLGIESPWFRVLAILCVGAAAHGGCLHSTFYLDDWWQIHDSEYVEGGRWGSDPGPLFTHLSYYLTWKAAGVSTVAFTSETSRCTFCSRSPFIGSRAIYSQTERAKKWRTRTPSRGWRP